MFTALESEAFFFYIQMVEWFTCDIKSQEKQILHPLMQVKGERNAMFIVALYLVIKEHKICLRLFLCKHSPMTEHVFFFPSLGPGVTCTLLTCTHPPLYFFPPLASCRICIYSVCILHHQPVSVLCVFSSLVSDVCASRT